MPKSYMPKVMAFCDESEYKVPWKTAHGSVRVQYVYAIGAVVVEGDTEFADVKDKLAALREEASHERGLTNHKESARIAEQGWHLAEDQVTTAATLWKFMGYSGGLKYHYRYFEGTNKVNGRDLAKVYAVLYASLFHDLLQRYCESELVSISFEQYDTLNSRFKPIIDYCARGLPADIASRVNVNVVAKGESDLSSVVDYMILGTSRLVAANEILCEEQSACAGQCRETLFVREGNALGHLTSERFEFRDFDSIRTSMSSAHKVRLHTGVLS